MATITELRNARDAAEQSSLPTAGSGEVAAAAPPPPIRFNPLIADTSADGRRVRKIVVIASVVAHALLLVALMVLPGPVRAIVDPSMPIEVVFTSAPPQIEPEPARPILAKPEPKLEPPPAPVPKPVEIKEPVAPVPEEPPPPPVVAATPKPPPRTVQLVSGFEAAPADVHAPARDQRTVSTTFDIAAARVPVGRSNPAARELADSSFDTAAKDPVRQRTPASAPSADTAFDSAPAKPIERTIASTVQAVGFDDKNSRVEAPKKRERPADSVDDDVEILSKVKPAYTEEARRLRIEGDVALEVTFLASGAVRVLRVVEGLGHGLDEAAIEAASRIRFTPARRNGQAVDHTATLRVIFRLA